MAKIKNLNDAIAREPETAGAEIERKGPATGTPVKHQSVLKRQALRLNLTALWRTPSRPDEATHVR
ncbi:hypothetical protein [Mesorhizobium carmichaelinearum]|uniref:hypothetical protein n=1 Tax=Mesorhizobium carmichaelinearum TaxID=1208188 RepID=UPI001FCE5DE9|nr:hypothetical protein [Mesorhizobium carmichaelinearum]